MGRYILCPPVRQAMSSSCRGNCLIRLQPLAEIGREVIWPLGWVGNRRGQQQVAVVLELIAARRYAAHDLVQVVGHRRVADDDVPVLPVGEVRGAEIGSREHRRVVRNEHLDVQRAKHLVDARGQHSLQRPREKRRVEERHTGPGLPAPQHGQQPVDGRRLGGLVLACAPEAVEQDVHLQCPAARLACREQISDDGRLRVSRADIEGRDDCPLLDGLEEVTQR
mmetsp:Transcript_28489/g.82085  ORF Transcript_28489/g.82085 Transcript_28489/m.82085 type:complete len:223 (-) Transcript_28489:88-756(-)